MCSLVGNSIFTINHIGAIFVRRQLGFCRIGLPSIMMATPILLGRTKRTESPESDSNDEVQAKRLGVLWR